MIGYQLKNSTQSSMREKFYKIAIALTSVFILFVLCWSFGVYLITPFYQSNRKKNFIKIAGFNDLLEEHPIKLSFEMSDQDAFLKTNEVQDVWVVKHSPKKATVFSPICPHLGCRYYWSADAKTFICPCHLSIFSISGKVLSGPAPRPLDTLPHEIKKGKLYVKWEMFKPGLSKKVEIASCPKRDTCKLRNSLALGTIDD